MSKSLASYDSDQERDEIARDDAHILESMGYKQELDRGLGAFMNFAFGFTEVSVLTSLSGIYAYGLVTGGSVVMVWGWITTFVFTMCVAYSMAEICSAYPSAGSVYHWAGMLVPENQRAIAAYICGWCNFLGNAGGDAAFAYSQAYFVAAGIEACGGSKLGTGWLVALAQFFIITFTFLNFFNVNQIGWISNIAAAVQVLTIFILLIGLLSAAPTLNSVEYVLTDYNNETGFSSTLYVCGIGLLTSLYGFSGYEASAHMAEETIGSRTAASYGIINTCFASGVVGLLYILTLLFVTTNIDDALDGKTSVAAVNVYLSAGGSVFGFSSVTVTGRITFALMRDGAFPYSEYWGKVNELTKAPARTLVFVLIFDVLLLLLPLVSTVAFDSIIGISTIGFDVSYGIPILLKVIYNYDNFPPTQMSLGVYSNSLNILSVVWLFGTSILLLLPTASPVTTSSMNYTVVVVGGFSALSAVYWFTYAKDNFRGPSKGKSDVSRESEFDPLLMR